MTLKEFMAAWKESLPVEVGQTIAMWELRTRDAEEFADHYKPSGRVAAMLSWLRVARIKAVQKFGTVTGTEKALAYVECTWHAWSWYIKQLRCERVGHNWIDESYGGPDSGAMGGTCKRCGESFHVPLY